MLKTTVLSRSPSFDGPSIEAALKWIKSLTAEPEFGVIYEGDKVWVKLMGFPMGHKDRGKVRLSMKTVDQETGEEIKKEEKAD